MLTGIAAFTAAMLGCSPGGSQPAPNDTQATEGDPAGSVSTSAAATGATAEGTTDGPTPPESETEEGSSTGSASASCGLPDLESLLTVAGPRRVEETALTFVDSSRPTPVPEGSEPGR